MRKNRSILPPLPPALITFARNCNPPIIHSVKIIVLIAWKNNLATLGELTESIWSHKKVATSLERGMVGNTKDQNLSLLPRSLSVVEFHFLSLTYSTLGVAKSKIFFMVHGCTHWLLSPNKGKVQRWHIRRTIGSTFKDYNLLMLFSLPSNIHKHHPHPHH